MRLVPAFGREFRDRSLKGWDPSGIVLVAVDLWLTREWSRELLLVVKSGPPVALFDFRLLAGCEVGVVCGERRLERGTEIAQLIWKCEPKALELVAWDLRRVWQVDPDPPDTWYSYVDAWVWWFRRAQITERCEAAQARELLRESRAA